MLRLPLKRIYYEEFLNGTKDVEFRRYGRLFNEQRFFIGRDVVLTYRYDNTGPFLATLVRQFQKALAIEHPEMLEFYSDLKSDDPLALIHLKVLRPISPEAERALRAAFKRSRSRG